MVKPTITYLEYETVGGVEFEVEVSFTPYRPAVITADPYYSYPEEGEDFEILDAWNVAEKRAATDDEFDVLEGESRYLKQKFFDKMAV